MPARGFWDPLWLFLALKFFHDQEQRHAGSPEPDALAQEVNCWSEDWPDQADRTALDWPTQDWQPDDDAPLWRLCQDRIPGLDSALDSDLYTPWD